MDKVVASYGVLVKAIKAQCVECMGGVRSEVKECTSPKCSLYPYRLGSKMRIGGKGRPDAFRSLKSSAVVGEV